MTAADIIGHRVLPSRPGLGICSCALTGTPETVAAHVAAAGARAPRALRHAVVADGCRESYHCRACPWSGTLAAGVQHAVAGQYAVGAVPNKPAVETARQDARPRPQLVPAAGPLPSRISDRSPS